MGALCFTPLSIIFPAVFWLWDFDAWRKGSALKMSAWAFHALIVAIGTFCCIGGTYATGQLIKNAYASGQIGTLQLDLLFEAMLINFRFGLQLCGQL